MTQRGGPRQLFDRYPDWSKYQVDLPEMERGPWKIEHKLIEDEGLFFNVTPDEWLMGRGLAPGHTYRLLSKEGRVWMSDTPAEIVDHMDALNRLSDDTGDVLITGLGLGMVVKAALESGRNVTVVEADMGVITLVGPHYQQVARKHNVTLTIVYADARTWTPDKGLEYTLIWHDIWPTIKSTNVPDALLLFQHYQPWCKGWQGAWSLSNSFWMLCQEHSIETDDVWIDFDEDGDEIEDTGYEAHEELLSEIIRDCHPSDVADLLAKMPEDLMIEYVEDMAPINIPA